MEANRVLDFVPEPVADLKVVGGKPASHPDRLQIVMQPLTELLILAGVTDEAGIRLGGMTAKRHSPNIRDHVLRSTAAAQEHVRNAPRGCEDCVESDGRRAKVAHLFEPQCFPK